MARAPRDEEHHADRARRMADLIASPVLPWHDVALFLDLPLATLDDLRAAGRGPRCFRLGRRLYVSRADLYKWLTEMAQTEA